MQNTKNAEERVTDLEKGFFKLTQQYVEMRQVLKLMEQDNSMALHSIHGLAEISEIKKKLASYIEQRGQILRTFPMFNEGQAE